MRKASCDGEPGSAVSTMRRRLWESRTSAADSRWHGGRRPSPEPGPRPPQDRAPPPLGDGWPAASGAQPEVLLMAPQARRAALAGLTSRRECRAILVVTARRRVTRIARSA
jgi:hypothetical protein